MTRVELSMIADRHLPLTSIAGVDEAGRGPWAGPVVSAAVVLTGNFKNHQINDSKRLTSRQRQDAFDWLCHNALIAVATNPSPVIDQLNIKMATLATMTMAVNNLPVKPQLALIDGLDVPARLPCAGKAIVKGDARHPAIGAASIIAKVIRDRIMVKMARFYPQYGFDQHKGYGTKYHHQQLMKFGPCPIHRQSFKPIRELCDQR